MFFSLCLLAMVNIFPYRKISPEWFRSRASGLPLTFYTVDFKQTVSVMKVPISILILRISTLGHAVVPCSATRKRSSWGGRQREQHCTRQAHCFPLLHTLSTLLWGRQWGTRRGGRTQAWAGHSTAPCPSGSVCGLHVLCRSSADAGPHTHTHPSTVLYREEDLKVHS